MPGHPTTLAYGRAGALLCLHQVRDGWAMFYFIFLISSILSSFSNASSVGRQLDILKYCGRGHFNPVVVVGNKISRETIMPFGRWRKKVAKLSIASTLPSALGVN